MPVLSRDVSGRYVVYEFGGCSLTNFLNKSSASYEHLSLFVLHERTVTPRCVCRYSGYFSEGQLRAIMRQLFAGLGYLHMCHVMHRDIKPDNILVEHQEMTVSVYTCKGFALPASTTIPFNSNVVWKRSCPPGFSLQCEYILLPSEDGYFHLAHAADPARSPVAPPLPLAASFILISVDLRVRIADFGLARECAQPQQGACAQTYAAATGATRAKWGRLKVESAVFCCSRRLCRVTLREQHRPRSRWICGWRRPARWIQSTPLS